MKSAELGTVEATFLDVVERQSFMFGAPIPVDALPDMGEESFVAAMSFRGGVRGRLILAMPHYTCLAVAANILGLEADEADDPAKAADALKELLNVVCGRILHEIVPGADYILKPPLVQRWSSEDVKAQLEKPGCYGFLLDDMPVLLRLELNRGGV